MVRWILRFVLVCSLVMCLLLRGVVLFCCVVFSVVICVLVCRCLF